MADSMAIDATAGQALALFARHLCRDPHDLAHVRAADGRYRRDRPTVVAEHPTEVIITGMQGTLRLRPQGAEEDVVVNVIDGSPLTITPTRHLRAADTVRPVTEPADHGC